MNTKLKYVLLGVFGSFLILLINDVAEEEFGYSVFAMFGGAFFGLYLHEKYKVEMTKHGGS